MHELYITAAVISHSHTICDLAFMAFAYLLLHLTIAILYI